MIYLAEDIMGVFKFRGLKVREGMWHPVVCWFLLAHYFRTYIK